MGQSQHSSDNQRDLLISNNHEKRLEENIKEYSSYKGIKSELDSFCNLKATNEDSRPCSQNCNSKNLDNVEITFIWREGGNEVFVTGSFSDWKQWFRLEKIEEVFIFKITLPKEKHFFKFVVDKHWVCSSLYETVFDDKGNLNNFVDLTTVPSKEKLIKSRKIKSRQLNHKDKKRSINSEMSQSSYSDSKPDRSGLNLDTPEIPCPYISEFNINILSVQNKKGNTQYLSGENLHRFGLTSLYTSCNTSVTPIFPGPHINM